MADPLLFLSIVLFSVLSLWLLINLLAFLTRSQSPVRLRESLTSREWDWTRSPVLLLTLSRSRRRKKHLLPAPIDRRR